MAKGRTPQRDSGTKGQKSSLGTFIILHLVLLVLSLTGILSKLASRQQFMSTPFILLYGAMLLVLAFYALVWQQVIKRLPLTLAYANRAITVVWGIVWGYLVFGEPVSPQMLIGAAFIIVGIVLFATDRDSDRDTKSDGEVPSK